MMTNPPDCTCDVIAIGHYGYSGYRVPRGDERCDQCKGRDALIERLTKERDALLSKRHRRFRLQDGPSVLWSVIEPHDSQCVKNHSQSLEEIAARGGLGAGEFWFVMNDQKWVFNTDWKKATVDGIALANQINERENNLLESLERLAVNLEISNREIEEVSGSEEENSTPGDLLERNREALASVAKHRKPK
jgi:hypothetical protein